MGNNVTSLMADQSDNCTWRESKRGEKGRRPPVDSVKEGGRRGRRGRKRREKKVKLRLGGRRKRLNRSRGGHEGGRQRLQRQFAGREVGEQRSKKVNSYKVDFFFFFI